MQARALELRTDMRTTAPRRRTGGSEQAVQAQLSERKLASETHALLIRAAGNLAEVVALDVVEHTRHGDVICVLPTLWNVSSASGGSPPSTSSVRSNSCHLGSRSSSAQNAPSSSSRLSSPYRPDSAPHSPMNFHSLLSLPHASKLRSELVAAISVDAFFRCCLENAS